MPLSKLLQEIALKGLATWLERPGNIERAEEFVADVIENVVANNEASADTPAEAPAP